MCEDAEAGGVEAGGTDLETRTPHNFVGKNHTPNPWLSATDRLLSCSLVHDFGGTSDHVLPRKRCAKAAFKCEDGGTDTEVGVEPISIDV